MSVISSHARIFLFNSLKRNASSSPGVFNIKAADQFKLEKGPSTTAIITKEEALLYYRKMQMMRRMEAAATAMYREKSIQGFCHLYSGQEAVAVGINSTMRPQDTVVSGYRVHGWAYLMGATVADVLSELAGKRAGCCRGKGGSMHLFVNNFYGGHGIVGAQVPIGAGLALASQHKKDGGVTFSLYGDGASNQGQVFEAFNMAKLWSLPCVFVCENNHFGMGTSSERSSASTKYYTRGDFIPGLRVDGMDVLAVRESTSFAIDYVTSGKGPIILEMETYRYSGHSMSDPGTNYRTREEVEEVRNKKDPITSFKARIVLAGLVEERDLKAIDGEVKAEVEKAQKIAVSEQTAGPEELTTDVYLNCLEPIIRNTLPNQGLKHYRTGMGKNKY